MTASVGDASVLEWLLDPSDPIAHHAALRLLLDRPVGDREVTTARSRIPDTPEVGAILEGQTSDGSWPRGRTSRPQYAATVHSLSALAELGMPADDPRAVKACELLLDRIQLPGEGFCARVTKPRIPHECGQAAVLFVLKHFGFGGDRRVDEAADWLVANQMLDGGWNCAHHPKGRLAADGVVRMDHECSLDLPHHKSSLFTTMAVLKGLATPGRPPNRVMARGVEFILQHRVHRARASRRAIYRWPPPLSFLGGGYDGLHPLRVLVMAGAGPDNRLDEALDYLEGRSVDGRWAADTGTADPETPNKWVTVHALHVLRSLRPAWAPSVSAGTQ